MSPGLSVVVPVLGELDRLARCLAALRRATAPLAEGEAEILVADDGTRGGIPDALRAEHPEVRWLDPADGAPLGFGGNANRGARAAQGRILCLLNSDMYVSADFFRGYAPVFDENEALFAVCARIREPGDVNAGLKSCTISAGRALMRFARDEEAASDASAPVPYANGGGSLFRRDRFLALGGFDPVFHPYYWEDTDLGYRAWRRGWEIRYDPARCLTHDHQGTIGREERRRVSRVKARNERLFLWRNLNDRSLATLVLRGALRDALTDLLRLRLRRVGWTLADLALLPQVARSRAAERRDAVRSDAEIAALWSLRQL